MLLHEELACQSQTCDDLDCNDSSCCTKQKKIVLIVCNGQTDVALVSHRCHCHIIRDDVFVALLSNLLH